LQIRGYARSRVSEFAKIIVCIEGITAAIRHKKTTPVVNKALQRNTILINLAFSKIFIC